MRRAGAATAVGAAGLALAVPAAAQTGVDWRSSINTIDPDAAVATIDIEGSIESLEVERQNAGRVSVTVSSDVLFAFDRATLTPKASATIERIGRKIAARRGPVLVDGYTDSVGSGAYNLGLSRRRAAAVSKALREVLPGRVIKARGHGESNPVAPNTNGADDNPAGRARNRRVTISVS
jgi:OOP family OmpA-OmpF porin